MAHVFESRPNPDAAVLTDLTGAARGENQHAYRKIDAATRLLHAWLDRAADHPDRDPDSYAHNALAEIATHLVVSTTAAEHYATLGLELDRLPQIRDAFAAGDIDYARARRIALALADYSDAVADAIQHDALAAAATCTPSEFDTALDALLIRTAPDEHAELQVDTAAEKRRVRKRKNGTLARIQADLSPEEAATFWQRLHELAATVCPGDPRDQRTLLADAYVAIGHGETTLACRCVGGVCTADTHRPPTRRTPLIQITIGVATLLGLRAEPAYLEGHGPNRPRARAAPSQRRHLGRPVHRSPRPHRQHTQTRTRPRHRSRTRTRPRHRSRTRLRGGCRRRSNSRRRNGIRDRVRTRIRHRSRGGIRTGPCGRVGTRVGTGAPYRAGAACAPMPHPEAVPVHRPRHPPRRGTCPMVRADARTRSTRWWTTR